MASQSKSSTAEEVNKKLDLIIKRLDTLESIIVEDPEHTELAGFLRLMKAGVGLYANPLKMVADSQHDQSTIEYRTSPSVHARLNLETTEVNVAEEVNLELYVVNDGRAPALLTKVEGIIPRGFDLVAKPEYCHLQDQHLQMNGKRLDPLTTEEIKIVTRSFEEGSYLIKPRIIFVDPTGHQIFCEPKPKKIKVSKTVLPGRISTGYEDLDNLLFGGIPENYAVILTSPPSDERDLLIKRFLETGTKRQETTFYITIDSSSVRRLAEELPTNFHLFICNPQTDTTIDNLPNVHKLRGIGNLTDINIAFNKALRTLGTDNVPRRACIEILSDVLLQHKAIQTRKWLNDLITELKSTGFTILAVMNPQMHPPQEVHAILGLFEGEITIHERETEEYSGKFLNVKRMHGQRYLESSLPLRKKRLQR